MDSTRAIIALWRLCVPAGLGPQVGGDSRDGAIPVDVLKVVLERELEGHLRDFGQNSADEILQTTMQPDADGVVGFLQFWKGMEEILRARGTMRTYALTPAQKEAITGFRFLRTCLLDMEKRQISQDRSSFSVGELRYFMDRTIEMTGTEGQDFWRQRAKQLPEDPEMLVTGEEVASALLTWLEDLVGEGPGEDEEEEEDSAAEDDEEEPEREASAMPTPMKASPVISYPSLAIPAAPTGPPPQRQVQRPSLVFERGLLTLLGKSEARPTVATKESVAEWREVIEFQVSLSRWMKSVQGKEELDLNKLHSFAKGHFGKLSARRKSNLTPRRANRHLLEKAAVVLKTRLRDLVLRRLSSSMAALRSFSLREAAQQTPGPTMGGGPSIFKELLKSQCQCAVMLETRVRLSHRAGGLAFCLAKLQRKTLRTALVALSSYQGTRSPASDLPPLTGGLGSINAQQLFTAFVPASSPSLMAPPRRGNLGRRAATSQL